MTADKLVETLREQAYWINYLADELESGRKVTCEWCIEPELISNLVKDVNV